MVGDGAIPEPFEREFYWVVGSPDLDDLAGFVDRDGMARLVFFEQEADARLVSERGAVPPTIRGCVQRVPARRCLALLEEHLRGGILRADGTSVVLDPAAPVWEEALRLLGI